MNENVMVNGIKSRKRSASWPESIAVVMSEKNLEKCRFGGLKLPISRLEWRK